MRTPLGACSAFNRPGATHLLSHPPSASIRHQHGRDARVVLQNQEGCQAPTDGEQTQSGQNRGRLRPEIHFICVGQAAPPWGEGLRRCLRPPQVCCWRSLLYPRQLRGTVSSSVYYPRCSHMPQRTKANKQAIESLAPRVNALDERLCQPVPEGDVKEQGRRDMLER